LDVVLNSLAFERAGKLVVPHAEGRAEIAMSDPVALVRGTARDPLRFAELADVLAEKFIDVASDRIEALLRGLVAEGFLITSLRAPMTCTDALAHLVGALKAAGASGFPDVVAVLAALEQISDDISAMSAADSVACQEGARAALVAKMNRMQSVARSPITVDLVLDCQTCLPESVAADMAEAAAVLTRVGSAPLGSAVWADYHRRFVERYGVGTLVPLLDVIDPAAGLGYPAGYPGSVLPRNTETVTDRDRRLLALAWHALAQGQALELNDTEIGWITFGDAFDARFIQPHVEIAARIRARSVAAMNAGEYELIVSPARSAGTLTARFQQATGDDVMARIYRDVPAMHQQACPVQLSCPPRFIRGQNVARLPAFLPEVLAIGEPPPAVGTDHGIPALRDLSVAATGRGLLLVEVRSGRILDPQVFHALALERQMPPLARFLTHLPRAFAASFSILDFGPAATELPHLPEARRGRIVLATERWRMLAAEVLQTGAGEPAWPDRLHAWQERHRCPDLVELADADMTLRLDLTVGAHAAILRDHMASHGSATLTPAALPEELDWIGHAHEIVLPVLRAGPAAPSKLRPTAPTRRNTDGHSPADPDAGWTSVRIHTHPDAMNHIIAVHLPELQLAAKAPMWMLRYRSPEHTDHLRLRIEAGHVRHGELVIVLGAWAAKLTKIGLAGPVLFDTYFPEVGRYGTGPALRAAEAVFCADTAAAVIALKQPPLEMAPDTVTALSMLDICEAFLGSMNAAAKYLNGRDLPPQTIGRVIVSATTRLARLGVPRKLAQLPSDLAAAWTARAEALAEYRRLLPGGHDMEAVATSLLHLHCNRHRGVGKEQEVACVRLARNSALSWCEADKRTQQ
jgi:thiopeptide-type bacteriocin biosynthesis protein